MSFHPPTTGTAPVLPLSAVVVTGPGSELEGPALFERLVKDPTVDVEKIERLMALWERGEARKAEAAFNAAMSLAQAQMKSVEADATNPQTRSRYASYAQLDRVLRPIYTGQGFGLSFDTADPKHEDWIRVVCYVTHVGGHSRTYHADMPADGKGAKGGDVMTKTHAVGAALSYGARYLLKLIFNVAVGEDDRDGNAPKDAPAKPEGYDSWLVDFALNAPNGLAVLQKAFQQSKREYREYLTKHDSAHHADLKARASKVKA